MHIAEYKVPKLTGEIKPGHKSFQLGYAFYTLSFSLFPPGMIRRKPLAQLFKLLQGYFAGYHTHRPPSGCFNQTPEGKTLPSRAGRPEPGRDMGEFFDRLQCHLLGVVYFSRCPALAPTSLLSAFIVGQHKTDRTFSNALVALLPLELGWLKGLVEVSEHFGRDHCLFIFQYNGNQLSKLNMEFRASWYHAGMPGHISFDLIWTAIANQAKKHLSAEERKLVCEAMCHDVATADRFYTAVPEVGDIFHIRDLHMRAHGAGRPRARQREHRQ
ncbi:hypothetical protein SRHO_G00175670 [Serrasalmus rhombeus]